MPGPIYESVIADALLTSVQSGEVRVNIGEDTENLGTQSAASVWGPPNFVSAPADPTAAGVCQVIYLQDGNQKVIFGTRDQRLFARSGNIKAGDSMMIAGTTGARVMIKDAKAVASLYTTHDKTDGGRPIWLGVDPARGLVFESPWGTMTFGPLGLQVQHDASGAELRVGAASGLPDPLGDLGSYAELSAGNGMLRLTGSIVEMGTDGGAANSLAVTALKTFTVAADAQAVAGEALVTALVTAIGLITATTPGAVAMTDPALVTAIAALTSATNALTSANTALQAQINGLGQVV